MKVEIKQDDGSMQVWEVRKPKGREIFLIENMDPDNPSSEESYKMMSKLLEKVIIKGPNGQTKDQINVDDLDADVFMELFYASSKSVLDVAKKFQRL